MEQTTTTLTNAIAELTLQIERLTLENAKLQEATKVDSAEFIPREMVMELLGLKDFNLRDVDSAVLIDFVRDNFGVDDVYESEDIVEWVKDNREEFGIEEIYESETIGDYAKYNLQIDDVYDESDIVEWVKDNRSVVDVFDHSDIMSAVTDFDYSDVVDGLDKESLLEEVESRGWSTTKDIKDAISQLEEVIEALRG